MAFGYVRSGYVLEIILKLDRCEQQITGKREVDVKEIHLHKFTCKNATQQSNVISL